MYNTGRSLYNICEPNLEFMRGGRSSGQRVTESAVASRYCQNRWDRQHCEFALFDADRLADPSSLCRKWNSSRSTGTAIHVIYLNSHTVEVAESDHGLYP